MKKIILSLVVLATFLLTASPAAARVSVRGYTRRNGTFVAPHFRSSPNRTRYDNWSTRGNINPYTFRRGYRSVWR